MTRFETVTGRGLALLALLALAALAPPAARAADPIFDAKGFSPNREFASELPFEHVDPLTGNLLLTFTDLVLPGGGGLDLRVQRTYNTKIYASYNSTGAFVVDEVGALGVGWTLHFGRVLNPTTSLMPGPVIEMPDGSSHPSYLHRFGGANPSQFMTRDYWTYDRNAASPVLRLPNGVKYVFGHGNTITGPLYATEISDPFGNRLDISYLSGDPGYVSSVTQRFASGEHRTVNFSYLSSPTRLDRITFGSRTWQFGYQTVNGFRLLRTVQAPADPAWVFDYYAATWPGPYLMRTVTTPNGGRIDYAYQAQVFYYGSSVVYSPALLTRTTGGVDIAPGTWTYGFSQSPPSPFSPIVATVTSPCARTVYTVNPIASTGDGDAWRIGTMASKQVQPPGGGASLESETFDWVASVAISENASNLGDPTHAPLLRSRSVVRAGQTYTTTHTYDTTDYSPARARNFNDYGRPIRTDETGQLARTTTRSYVYPAGGEPGFSSSYIVDNLDTETVTVGTESFTNDYDFNAAGFLTRQSLYGIVTTFTPDRNGSVASRRDARGNTTSFNWLWGVPRSMQTPVYSITRQVASDSTITSETRRGFTTGFTYDGLFRLRATNPPVGFDSVVDYSADGRTMTATRGSSSVTSSFDGFGRVSATANNLAVPVSTDVSYDACGRKTYESHPFTTTNIGSTYAYDALDRLDLKTNPDATNVDYAYSGINVTIRDEISRITTQVWQAFGDPRDARLASVADAGSNPNGTSATTSYQYNAVGSLTQVTPPVGGLRRWIYDTSNLLRQEIHPESGTVTYTYYPDGLVATRTDPQFGLTRFDYDGNNRLVEIDRPGDASDAIIRYDNSDNRTLLVRGLVNSSFGPYDGNNNLLARKDRIGTRSFTARYGYDGNDRLARIDYPSGSAVGYAYDNAGRVTSVNNGGAFQYAHTFAYHPSGGVGSYVTNNGVTHGVSYDHARYWINGASTALGATGLTSVTYGHDGVGNVTALGDYRLGSFTLVYDGVDRLRTVVPGAGGIYATAFAYDAIGNRTSKTLNSATTTYAYNATTNRLDVASGAEPASFGYDLNGNTASDGSATYTFDADNMLATATPTGGSTTTYAYDGDSLRKLRQSGSSSTYFIHGPGGQLLSEYQTVGTEVRPVREYVSAGGRLIASVRPPVLTTTPGELNYAVVLNAGPSAAQPLTIETTGTVLPWQAQTSAGWILLSATSGSTPATINVSVNPAGLQVGTYTGTIAVSATGALGSPRAVTVRMAVVPTPGLVVLPRPLRFLAVEGDHDVLLQPLSVLHAGAPAAVAWTATSDAPWLSLGPASGTTPSNVQAQVNPSGLARGTHRAAITVTAPGAQGSPKLVPVELLLQPGPGATCEGAYYFCEPFDALASGPLGGQGGWTSQHGASAEVAFDPRGRGKALLVEPPPGGTSNESHEFTADLVINGTEVSAQIMTDEVAPDAQQVAKLEFFTLEGVAWGKTGRTYGALRFGSQIFLQFGPSIHKVLVPQVESGRFYDVRVVYQGGRVYAYVDGQQVFSSTNPVPDSYPPTGFAITGWDRGTGQAYIDLIEGRRAKPGLVVEPAPLRLSKPPSTPVAPLDEPEKESAQSAPPDRRAFGRLPLGFEPNVGQAPAAVSWFARSAGHALWLGRDELVLTAPATGAEEAAPPLRLRFEGAAPASVEGVEPLPGKLSYFVGNDPRAWRTGLRRHARVRYSRLYPGVDLEVYAREHALEYDFIVAPGADPAQVRLSLEGARSARLDARGDLVLETAAGEVRQQRPLIYQERDGRREPVEGGYVLASAREIAFHLGEYDRRRPLVIDPTLVFSTYLGGDADDAISAMAVDADGSVYVAGTTHSATLAGLTPNEIGSPLCQGCAEAFVAKFSASGTALEYLTYIVAQGNVVARGLAVDAAGRAHLAGWTSAADFPTAPVGAVIQPTLGGGSDAFVLRLDPVGGALEYSTYLGGSGTDEGRAVTVDAAGRAFVAGSTTSTNFPLLDPLPGQGALQGTRDAFVSSISPTGTALGRSSFLGGSGDDLATDVAFDATVGTSPLPEKPPGLYVVGLTTSANFPVSPGALKTVLAAGDKDIFVAKVFATATNGIVYATFLGGTAFEGATCATAPCGPVREVSVAVDTLRTAHVASTTNSTDFPPPWPVGQAFRRRGFVAGVADGGQRLVYVRDLESVELADIAINATGMLAVAGTTQVIDQSYGNFPLVFPVQQASLIGFQWAAAAKLAPNGTSIIHSTHLGGTDTSGGDNKTSFGTAVAIDDVGAVYVAGATDFASFITQDPLQTQYVPGGVPAFDAFVTKIGDADLSDPRKFEFALAESATPEEGTSLTVGGAPATLVTVKRVGPLDQAASVECRTLAGTATLNQDFVGSVRTLAFAPGVATATCEVELIDDELAEPAEFLTLSLANPTGGVLGPLSRAKVVIEDNDGLVRNVKIRDRVQPSGPNWTITEGISWLSFSALAGLGPSTVVATADPTGLPPGTYNDFFTVTGDTGDSPQYIEVILRVLP